MVVRSEFEGSSVTLRLQLLSNIQVHVIRLLLHHATKLICLCYVPVYDYICTSCVCYGIISCCNVLCINRLLAIYIYIHIYTIIHVMIMHAFINYYVIHVLVYYLLRIQRGPVRGISLKLQEEEPRDAVLFFLLLLLY